MSAEKMNQPSRHQTSPGTLQSPSVLSVYSVVKFEQGAAPDGLPGFAPHAFPNQTVHPVFTRRSGPLVS